MINDKICIYAICKNESKFIDQWLDSMQEADYIVVLDTGSTDGTFEKLKKDKRVTKVKQQIIDPWRFDVARNESMKLIPKDATILMCTDFDELLNPGWAKVLKEAWTPETTRVHYSYAWSHNEIGEPTDVFVYDKIHTRDYQWVFPVHEVLEAKDPNFIERCVDVGEQIYLHHYPDKEKSRSNYFDLLKISVDENPDDSHVQMLYAREFLLNNRLEESLEEYLKVLRMPDVEAPNKRLVLLESLGRVASIYVQLKNYDEAIWYSQEFIKEDPTYREPYFILGEIYNDMKMYTLAEAMVDTALKYGVRKYDWIERAPTWICQAEDILAISYYHLGKLEDAIKCTEICIKHNPNDIRLYKNLSIFLQEKLDKNNQKVEELEND